MFGQLAKAGLQGFPRFRLSCAVFRRAPAPWEDMVADAVLKGLDSSALVPALTVPVAQFVARQIARDTVEPRVDLRMPLEPLNAAVGPNENFLGNILCVFMLAQKTIDDRVDAVFVPADEFVEGRGIAVSALFDQGEVGILYRFFEENHV